MTKSSILKFIASLCLSFSAAAVGSLATTAQSEWYVNLTKPSFNPPGWVFGPVWTILYILIGVSFFLVWQKGFSNKTSRIALICFFVQLVFNAAWTLLFFGLQSPLLALVDIVLLCLAITLTIRYFLPISKVATGLLVPYLAWVAFATALNASIWRLNP